LKEEKKDAPESKEEKKDSNKEESKAASE